MQSMNPMEIDQVAGGAASLATLLNQSQSGALKLLPVIDVTRLTDPVKREIDATLQEVASKM